MTERVWVPARRRSPGHTLCLDSAAAAAFSPKSCRLRTLGSDMLLSGHLCLFTIVGLIVPTRGTVHPELQSTPQTSTLQAAVPVETTSTQTETQTQQPMRVDVLLTTDPGTDKSSTEGSILPSTNFRPLSADPTKGTTLSNQSPGKDFSTDPALRPTGSSEDDPFFYDETALRKRGLLVAAVLFITGIIILTSGKCRQLSRLCRNYNRTYRIVTKAQPEREDTDGARARVDGLNSLPSQTCPP